MVKCPCIHIGNNVIGSGNTCFIVAEISGNHHQHYREALELIEIAAEAGADAVKLQTYTPDTMTIDSDKPWFRVQGKDQPDVWKGETLYHLYQKAYTPWEWHSKLKALTERLGLVFFSTPFDTTAVDFLEELDVPCYKVASYEATDITLLKRIARTGKPVIMSVGFATLDEITLSVEMLRDHGAGDIALLHCVTAYSDRPILEQMNLRTMTDLGERFGVVTGFSDNNGGIDVPIAAALMGASIIEKHVIHDKQSSGLDARFSLVPAELDEMVAGIRRAESIMGSVHFGVQGSSEEENRHFRRSLFVVENVKLGEVFTTKNMRCIRPASGLEPKFYDNVLGKHAARDVVRGTPLTMDLLAE